MFMAAAPEGQHELDYEAEETAILDATRLLPMRVVVEETGALEFLGARLATDEGPFEALHLSCHGDIDREKGPILLLETAEGGADRVGPGAIVGALGADPPPLVVLSACRTAERGGSPGAGFTGQKEGGGADRLRDSGQPAAQTGPELATPFVRRLAATIANVVGWDGSVYDADASAFATHFYKQLAGRSSGAARGSGRAAGAARPEDEKPEAGAALASRAGLHRPERWRAAVRTGQAEAKVGCGRRRQGIPRRQAARAGGDARGIRRAAARNPARAAIVSRIAARRVDPRHGRARQVEPRRTGPEPDAAASTGRDLRALRRARDLRRGSRRAGPEAPGRREGAMARGREGRSAATRWRVAELALRSVRRQADPADRRRPRAHSRDALAERRADRGHARLSRRAESGFAGVRSRIDAIASAADQPLRIPPAGRRGRRSRGIARARAAEADGGARAGQAMARGRAGRGTRDRRTRRGRRRAACRGR